MTKDDDGDMHLSAPAKALVQATVMETLLSLGIDVSSPGAVLELQKDFAQLRNWRQASAQLGGRAGIAAIGTVMAGLLGAALLGIQQMIRGGGVPH